MRYAVPAALVFLLGAGPLHAHGLLIPDDKSLPPLAMLYHRVNVTVEDQAAVTTVEQAFRNHTDRQLEATYIFPVPKGASVNKFSMWIGDNEASGELLPSDKARQIYTDIVRRTQDPALLEYMGNDLLRLRVFPVPPRSDQKVKMSFTAIARQDDGVVEYVYPLQTTSKPVTTLEDFSIKLSLKSQHPIQNIYSPTHAIDVVRSGDREASVDFRREEATLNKDFQLFWSVGSREIGVTTLAHRPVTSEDGYVLLLVSPQLEASKDKLVPRDVVLVLDTSGSMDGVKMEQAKRALKYCLEHLNPQDRFGLVAFATTVRSYRDELVPVSPDHVANAKRWVDGLKAGGGTALQPGLDAALAMRSSDDDRTFTVAFFSDGQPTIGEMKPEAILKRVGEKTRGNTRIFTFGVGDEVNAALLDKLADETRAVSTYVRPAEDIATKVASIYNKISHPVMANVRLSTSENVRLHEVYPPELPDLFHGSQLVVLARYTGQGSGAVKLSGTVGTEPQEFAYDVTFPIHTDEARDFVEHLWARRKVGYLLDQIRLNGEQKELIDEVTSLATKYGIATPYTSHLVVPDAPMPVVRGGEAIPGDVSRPGAPEEGARAARLAAPAPVPAGLAPPGAGLGGFGGGGPQPFARDGAGIRGGLGGGFAGRTPAGGPGFARGAGAPGGLGGLGGTAGGFPAMPQQSQAPKKVVEFAKENQAQPEQGAANRGRWEAERLEQDIKRFADAGPSATRDRVLQALKEAKDETAVYREARTYFANGELRKAQTGKLGVDLAICAQNLRAQKQLDPSAVQNVAGRNCMEIGGVWIDQDFNAKLNTVVVRAQSEAYFRILEKQPRMKEVFKLGNHLVWVTPNNTALVIDANDGTEKLPDEEIDKLFVAAKN